MSEMTYEVVTFELRDEADPEAFIRASGEVEAWLREQPGLVDRSLLVPAGDDRRWVDIARWTSLEAASAAAAKFEAELAHCEFEQLIEPSSVVMQHLRPASLANAGAPSS